MKRNIIMTALAGAAIVVSGPALAKPGNGGGHGNAGATVGAAANGRIGAGGGASAGGSIGSDINTTVGSSISTRGNGSAMGSMGTGAGSTRGSMNSGSAIDMRGSTSARTTHMNSNAGTNIGAQSTGRLNTQLSGITSGMNVVDSGGATVGTVTGITTRGNGTARTVQVTLTDGTVINLDSRSLSLNGGVLTTTSTTTTAHGQGRVNSQGPAHASVQGLTHASPNSVLSGAGVTTLTGLAAGATVNDTGGTLVGTVGSIVTNRSGAVVGINVTLDGGGTVFIPATSLSMDGTTVVTTTVPHG